MRAGRVEEAGALASQIGLDITRRSKRQLHRINGKTDTKELWAAVRRLTRGQHEPAVDPSITADVLNRHYAAISRDDNYEPPLQKQSVSLPESDSITEYTVFRILDGLRSTATGLDDLPAWYLRLGAAAFCGPVTVLFNLSLRMSTVPVQWKQACIRPIPKLTAPQQPADFRPISITPVLTRVMERIVVRQYIYPALLSPPPTLNFSDQFAFRPTGSTTAAIITLLDTVIDLLSANPYVIVVSLDFSKAFDTIRHSTLLHKISQLDLPDHVYNWLANYFSGHYHYTSFRGHTSSLLNITASIIQGSAIGPASYVINTGDLIAIILETHYANSLTTHISLFPQ